MMVFHRADCKVYTVNVENRLQQMAAHAKENPLAKTRLFPHNVAIVRFATSKQVFNFNKINYLQGGISFALIFSNIQT